MPPGRSSSTANRTGIWWVCATAPGFFIQHNGTMFEDLGHDFIPRGVNAARTIVGESQRKAAILQR